MAVESAPRGDYGLARQRIIAAAYTEIENLQELRYLSRKLAAKFSGEFPYRETRMVGSPGGNFEARVRFRKAEGDDIFWWSPHPHRKKRLDKNLFGHGTPGHSGNLNMDIQFNVPAGVFTRNSGGAFLRHDATNQIVLAHRGIATIGHGRVRKAIVFSGMSARLREANTTKGQREFLVIGDLKSASLVNDMARFASQIRAVTQDAGIRRVTGPSHTRTEPRGNRGFPALRKYFKEFTGRRATTTCGRSIADCYHGDVIDAIRDSFAPSIAIYKSREIDLVIAHKQGKVFLFEAKTSADTQSIYTAVGQLVVHAPRVAQQFATSRLEKVIVLPDFPSVHLREVLKGKLRIHVLTFTRSSDGQIAIDGLDKFHPAKQASIATYAP